LAILVSPHCLRGLTASYMRDKVSLPSVGKFIYPHGWLDEPIGHLLAVDPTLSYIGFSSLLEGAYCQLYAG
ncbi:hypothetical protein, partial [Virgibacillus salarius]|uniref:hypothetical protein n=1 Tax=Virgibacillus salarius TaxID=447199 RepID=UPI0031D90E1B